jgi:hypothetical protein
MARIPVRIGQENQIKVITSFGAPNIPYLAVNATNVVGGIVTSTQLSVDGPSEFLGISSFSDNVYFGQSIQVEGNASFTGDFNFYGNVNLLGIGKTYGVAYFGQNSEILSTQSPTTGFQTSNLLLTTNANNIPVWTDTIDGGSY